jgi:hypothetical protein
MQACAAGSVSCNQTTRRHVKILSFIVIAVRTLNQRSIFLFSNILHAIKFWLNVQGDFNLLSRFRWPIIFKPDMTK